VRDTAAAWERVEQVVGQAQSVHALRTHRVELIAARLWRRQEQPVPDEVREQERRAAAVVLASPILLRRVRAACDGRLVLMKGPEVAVHYPEPTLRPFIDLDLLAADARAAWHALRRAGFVEVGDPMRYTDVHHLRPLAWPGLPLAIELHHEVNQARWLRPPATAELLELTQPSATGVPDLFAPVPAAHAVLLAAHAWVHEPFRRLLDLIDIAMVLDERERGAAARLARRWGFERIWRATIGAVDSIVYGSHRPISLRVLGGHLAGVRERTVVETHLARWAGPAYGLSSDHRRALWAATAYCAEAALPRADERWIDALRRTALALAHAFRPQSNHDRTRELLRAGYGSRAHRRERVARGSSART
jgi:hypothetical protein